jgi:hypothetical protein
MADGLSHVYEDLLDGSYDCVDRIVAGLCMGIEPVPTRLSENRFGDPENPAVKQKSREGSIFAS